MSYTVPGGTISDGSVLLVLTFGTDNSDSTTGWSFDGSTIGSVSAIGHDFFQKGFIVRIGANRRKFIFAKLASDATTLTDLVDAEAATATAFSGNLISKWVHLSGTSGTATQEITLTNIL